MKKLMILFAAAFISCSGGNSAGSNPNKTIDTQTVTDTSTNDGVNKIDSSAAALPTDTAPYKRKP